MRLVRNANGAETTSTIDGLSRVVGTETRFDGPVLTTATTWDANGNKETETDRRGVTRRFVYDDLNRLKAVEIVSGLSGEGPTGTIAEYGYDLVGNKTSETNLAGLTTRFELDGLYRVKAKVLPETMPDGFGPPGPLTEEYGYDQVGNLTVVSRRERPRDDLGVRRAQPRIADHERPRPVRPRPTSTYDDPRARRRTSTSRRSTTRRVACGRPSATTR